MKRAAFVLCLLLSMPGSAHALTEDRNYTTETVTVTTDLGTDTMILDSPNRTILDYIGDYVDVPEGAMNWKIFGTTKEIKVAGKTKDGYDFEYLKPDFSADIKKLDGRIVTVKGFMFPLNETTKQKQFLFGPFPVSCPFHYHVSSSLIMEVHADKTPVKFSYDPVLLKGRLQLVDKDPENSTFYRLLDAKKINH
jgi:hypothetical protein